MINETIVDEYLTKHCFAYQDLPYITKQVILRSIDKYIENFFSQIQVKTDNMNILCGRFEVISKRALPHQTKIKIDGREVDYITEINLSMDCHKSTLNIGIEPYVMDKKG